MSDNRLYRTEYPVPPQCISIKIVLRISDRSGPVSRDHGIQVKLKINPLFHTSSSAFALYIERFAYYGVFYFVPYRLSISDFSYSVEGESTSGYTFTPLWGSFACLA
jgi:hypothetical protein